MSKNITEPRTLPGFMELLPTEQIQFNEMKKIIQNTYEKYGFLPLDTPVIEFSQVLLAKAGGETEQQIYRFMKGETDLSLRFDLTVPLSKYVAKNYGNLSFPFRRYQIGKVYRGEKVQTGRYREFYQCDIDIIGDGELDVINDAELPSIIYNIFKELGFNKFIIRINNRKLLNGLFDSLELTEISSDIIRVIDKIDKIGKEKVIQELEKLNISNEKIQYIVKFIEISGTNKEKVQKLKELNIDNEIFKKGLEEIEIVENNIGIFGVPEENYMIDLTIARGLDYYTGTVYETFLTEYRELGSVCSGGRYENLAGYYINKELPGVGVSIGLTRLFYKLNELNLLKQGRQSISDILIIPMDQNLETSLKLANELRNLGTKTEVYLNDKKLKAKLKYADKLKIPYIVLIGEEEINTNKVKVKNMTTGEEIETILSAKEIIEVIKK